MSSKTPDPIDKHVGNRVRMRRMLVGLSQERLGERLGLTFQQIQKYEKGANRIGAGRLFQISRILGVPIAFFYEGLPEAEDEEGRAPSGASDGASFDLGLLSTSEAMNLNTAYFGIRDASIRKRILDLIKEVSEKEK